MNVHPGKAGTVAELVAIAGLGALITLAQQAVAASPPVPARVTQTVDVSDTLVLPGNTHPLLRSSVDQGVVAVDLPLSPMYVVLQRSPAQEQELAAFNERQQDPRSADYHHWLTPVEFGRLYGPNDADIAAVTAWLQSSGLKASPVSAGRVLLEFSGTAAQVQRAFGVQMHSYLGDGAVHIANDRDPQIPRALSPVIRGIAALTDFPVRKPKPPGLYVRRDGRTGRFTPLGPTNMAGAPLSAAAVSPEFAFTENSQQLQYVTPYDFATIYHSLPLWNASTPIVGTGVNVAIIGGNPINLNDIATFRSAFGLPPKLPNIIYTGARPKADSGNADENTLDVEMVGAAAPGATITLVVPPSAGTLTGFLAAAAYVNDQEVASIVTSSAGECELFLGASGNAAINAVWQQGATQGISIFNSSGDEGSAGCSARKTGVADSDGVQVSGFSSSPYVTGVGGTDFGWNWLKNGVTTYWNSTNAANGSSAKGYVPEIVWNTSCGTLLWIQNYFFANGAALYQSPEQMCNLAAKSTNYSSILTVEGSTGGASRCTNPSGSTSATCAGAYPKPTWQAGTGVPADGVRDVPDVSLFASYGWPDLPAGKTTPLVFGTEILYCFSGNPTPCQYDPSSTTGVGDIIFQGNGGTSAASPYWAGIMALIVQKNGGVKQGLANPVLYSLAAGENLAACNANTVKDGNSCIFYDITYGNNAQDCVSGGPDCVPATTGDAYAILPGYAAGAGYDQATGLGSVNITNLVNAWPASVIPTDTYVPSTRQVTIPHLLIGEAIYSNVVLTVGNLISGPSGSTPNGVLDSYDPATGQLTVQTVQVGGVTYHNVVASVAGLVSIDSVAGADTYDGTDLNSHLVQVQGHTYANVAVTIANVVSAGGGLPKAAVDVYDSTSRQLAIPAVEFDGQVHTNVVVTVGALIAVEGQVN